MIIDISYIKRALNVEVEDSIIKYLIDFYFDYLCEHVNVETSLDEQEILNDNLEVPIENPNISNDDLTIFQETIIYGIACHLLKMNISITIVPQELYNEYIELYKQSKEINYEIDTLTYCDLFDICLNLLSDYLNDTSNVGYLRRLLGLYVEDISNDEIEFLIEHYTSYLKEILPKVDEVREEFGLAFDKFGNTWCDLANAALGDLKKKTYGYYGLRAYDRPGARTKYGYHGPTSRI